MDSETTYYVRTDRRALYSSVMCWRMKDGKFKFIFKGDKHWCVSGYLSPAHYLEKNGDAVFRVVPEEEIALMF